MLRDVTNGAGPFTRASLQVMGRHSPTLRPSPSAPWARRSSRWPRSPACDELEAQSAMAGRQLPFFSLLVPVWLVWVMAGWRGVVGVWPALLVCGGSFALVQFLMANFHGPWLVDVAGGLVSLVCLALFLRVWQPRRSGTSPTSEPPRRRRLAAALHARGRSSRRGCRGCC